MKNFKNCEEKMKYLKCFTKKPLSSNEVTIVKNCALSNRYSAPCRLVGSRTIEQNYRHEFQKFYITFH